MLTIHHMYFYITQNNSKFGAGSLREHCIIMFQKSLLPLSASAALTEPAGEMLIAASANQIDETAVMVSLPSLTAAVSTQARRKEALGTQTSKSLTRCFCTLLYF